MKKKGEPNRSSYNAIKSLCVAWVRENEPSVYLEFQKALGIKSKSVSPRLQTILDQTSKKGSA